MPEPDRSADKAAGGDLFDRLPTASPSLPKPERPSAPAPGSRRAAREARRAAAATQRAAADAHRTTPAPAETHRSAPASGQADASSARPRRSTHIPMGARQAGETPLDDEHRGDEHRDDEHRDPVPEHRGDEHGDHADRDDAAHAGLEALFAPEQHREVPRKSRRRGWIVALIVVLVLGGGIAAGGAWVWSSFGDRISDALGWGEPKDYEPGQAHGEALITIEEGDTGRSVSSALHEAGVTKTDAVFYDWLIAENVSITFHPGVYKLQKQMTAAAAAEALQDPATRMENSVRIPEGGTVQSSLPLIAEGVGIPLADLEAAVADPSVYGVTAQSLEGWLFPAVYTFDPSVTAQDVIARMVERTRESLAAAGVPDAEAHRVLTIASIIEREARTADFAKVSRVIRNRLDQGMKLQMDSTAQYGYGELHAGSASTSEEAQFDANPWNTYVIDGLPAGPIANPGDAAIDAAMHPADGPWLYFVTVNMDTGETRFSESYEQHQQGIREMQEWCSAHPDSGC
ncbi:endolytic transglycosylase MltG [Microbacterium sp. EF45047]|uniref:endolytic transglycosylase MltG n=1 Tax=Microbacterium sp. EF45047 TaxID=2809708 RepID=UPI00234B3571|nr:endolytic transglycosylase MltG [Microbacterium sp. EF45047]WCM54685.1 endolytic transglycosylase MltG [Microbacterium sp. EF45047]